MVRDPGRTSGRRTRPFTHILENTVSGNAMTRDRIGVIWFVVVSLIWKARNNMIFNHVSFESKTYWKSPKSFLGESLELDLRDSTMILSMWRTNPLACVGASVGRFQE
jgi:hypothetical protein